jgi:hypothetical protein
MVGSENSLNFEHAEQQGKRFLTFQRNVSSSYSKAKESMNSKQGLLLEIYKSVIKWVKTRKSDKPIRKRCGVGARVIEDHATGTSKPLYESCFTLKEHKSIIHNDEPIGSGVSAILYLREQCNSIFLLFTLHKL